MKKETTLRIIKIVNWITRFSMTDYGSHILKNIALLVTFSSIITFVVFSNFSKIIYKIPFPRPTVDLESIPEFHHELVALYLLVMWLISLIVSAIRSGFEKLLTFSFHKKLHKNLLNSWEKIMITPFLTIFVTVILSLLGMSIMRVPEITTALHSANDMLQPMTLTESLIFRASIMSSLVFIGNYYFLSFLKEGFAEFDNWRAGN